MEVVFDKDAFWNHIKTISAAMKKGGIGFQCDAFVLVTNDKTDEIIYHKALAIQHYLFGYELTGMILAIVKNTVYVIASQKKVNLLQQLGSNHAGMELNLTVINKEDKNAANLATLMHNLSNAGNRVGVCLYKNVQGDLATSFVDAFRDAKLEQVDITVGLAEAWGVKDEQEEKCCRKAAELSTDIFQLVVDKVEAIIDQDTSVKHSTLSAEIDAIFANPAASKLKAKTDNLESCYVPIIMSGGKYDLKASAVSNDENLHQGTIIIELGARYKYYCSNIARTLLINPTQQQEENYKILLKVYQTCITTLRNGVALKDVWNAAIETITKENPSLVPKFTRNCGFSTGLEFREPALVINEKATAKARLNMVFNIAIGFSDLTQNASDPRSATYALFIADTVLVTDDQCERLTHFHREFSEVSYKLGEEEEEPESKEENKDAHVDAGDVDPSIFVRKTRSQSDHFKEKLMEQQENEKRRKTHQIELFNQKQIEAKKLAEDGNLEARHEPDGYNKDNVVARDINSYTASQQFPGEMRAHQIFVDVKHETILFPIAGRMVPFHVDMVKSANTAEEGIFTYLRVNFENPQQIYGKNVDTSKYYSPEHALVRELTYRAKDPKNLLHVSRTIKELKKNLTTRRKEQEEKASLVEQQNIIIGKNGALTRLRDVTAKPVLAGRKNIGVLECHQNGFRFIATKGNIKGDIIFSNIKHAFYQPASDRSISVLIHFHLKNEVLWGKKKTKDVQFYVDVVDASQDLGNIRNKHDADGIQEEQEERMLRQKTNERFKEFCRKVEELSPEFKKYVNQFDVPFRDLLFSGVPGKSNVDLMPSVFCITALEDQPAFVLTLADIEVAMFERIQGSLKNFDVVFVYKDFTRPVQRITAIPREHFETLKEFLDSSDILYFQGRMNLDWNTVMNEIRGNLEGFFLEDGGWSFLDMENEYGIAPSDDEEEEGSEEEENDGSEKEGAGDEQGEKAPKKVKSKARADSSDEDDSEFEISEDESGSDESEEDYTSDSDASDASDSDGSFEEEEDDDEDDASDWDELERRAAADDRARDNGGDDSDDSDDRKKKRPHSSVSGPASKGAPPKKPNTSSSSAKPVSKPSASSSKPVSSNKPGLASGARPGQSSMKR